MKESSTAKRLNQIMQERNLKQSDILKLCEPYCEKYGVRISKGGLSQYVSGKFEPKQDKLTILGLGLNVSESWLMGFDVPMERTATAPLTEESAVALANAATNPMLSDCAQKLYALSDQGRLQAYGYITALYDKENP